jgi:guanylate kinase
MSALLLIISGPSGVGKTTITHEVVRALDGLFSVSLTTRKKAMGDRDGMDYHFVSQGEFNRARDNNELLEWAEVYPGLSYGTPRKPVDDALTAGRLMILEIDVDGAMQVKEKIPRAYSIFVLPPNESVLLQRLRARGRDDETAIQRRFAKAKKEIIKAWESGVYDEFIVNRDLSLAVKEAVTLVSRRRENGTLFA